MQALAKQLKSCALALLVLSVLTMVHAAHAKRAYTVDDMLRLEQIGKVRFDPSGEHLIFEHYGPYDQQSDYSRYWIRGEMRSRIYIADLTKDAVPRLLFDQKRTDSYTISGISPDGAYVGYDHSSERGFSEGIVSLASRQARDFSFSPDYFFDLFDAQWIPRHRLAYTALKAGDQPFRFAVFAQRIDLLVSKWHQTREGKVPTASAIGSGIYADFPGYGERLVLADADDGSSRILGPGKYDYRFASPDGKLLAGLRNDRLVPDPSEPLEHNANMGAIVHTLVIYDLTGNGRAIEPCKGCDVLAADSLDWSPSGRYLAFVAREHGRTWEHPTFWIFDRQSGRAERQSLGGLSPHRGRHGNLLIVPVVWLGDRLAVLLDRPGAAKSAELERDVRADWYLLGGNSPVNLTASFPGKTPDLIATTTDGLILTDGKDAWLVDASGHKRNLSRSISEPVTEWQKPSPYGLLQYHKLPHYDMQPIKTLVLQTKITGEHQPRTLYFIDVASGAVSRVAFPSPTAEAMDASAATDRVAFLDYASNATVLSVAGTQSKPRRILEINGFLRDVVGGTPVAIDHKGPKGDSRRSWMLLPPGHKRGDKLPTVVNVYPGWPCLKTFSRWRLDQVIEVNDHILAAHGYAVLYPCIPLDYEEVPREPAKHIVQQVFAAVDAAVAQGYVDPDRLAIQGQSYGGYTTGLLVGLTHRFKSAVAQSGLYDLISYYGEFDRRARLDIARKGLSMFGVSISETSQTGMGASPWDAPQRYLRNSPLMHVKAITTPILLINGDIDSVNTTQSEEFFTALTRLHKNAEYVRYFGEGHVFRSPANIRDMWHRIFDWYAKTLGPPVKVNPNSQGSP